MMVRSDPDELLPIILNQFNSILLYSHSGSALERLAEDQAQQILDINEKINVRLVDYDLRMNLKINSSSHKTVLTFCIKSLADKMLGANLTHWLG